jgi:hypothetical protein
MVSEDDVMMRSVGPHARAKRRRSLRKEVKYWDEKLGKGIKDRDGWKALGYYMMSTPYQVLI